MEGSSRVPGKDIQGNKPLNKTQLLFLYGDPYDISDNEKDRQKERLKNGTNPQAAEAPSTRTSEGLKPTAEAEDQPNGNAKVSDSNTTDTFTRSASHDDVFHQQDLPIRRAFGNGDIHPGTLEPLPTASVQRMSQKLGDGNQEQLGLAGSETIPHSDAGALDIQTVGAMADEEVAGSSDYEAKLKKANKQIKNLEMELAQQYEHAADQYDTITSLRERAKERAIEQEASARDLSTAIDQLQDQRELANSMVGLAEERDRIAKEKDRLLMEKSELLVGKGDLQDEIARFRNALALRDAELRKIQNANARQSGDDAARDAMEYVREVEDRANVAEKLVKELRQQLKELDY